jgi:CheY-like chemotaxis protein
MKINNLKTISAQKNILIVDDSIDSQVLLTTLFESFGYRVHHVSNGKEALSLLMNCEIMPDVILLDYQMPIMSGLEFRIHQLQDFKLQNIPVVLMTGDSSLDLDALMKKPYAIFIKPLQIHQLIETVKKCLGN